MTARLLTLTLTGNPGTVEITVDGTTQISTWAALASTPIDGARPKTRKDVEVSELPGRGEPR